jgi:hypothetical protein
VHIELHQRRIAYAEKTVNLARLDHQDVARPRLELLIIDLPLAAPRLDELNFILRMPVRPRAASGLPVEEEDRNAHFALIGAYEVVRAPPERKLLLSDTMHVLEWLVCVTPRAPA